MNETPSTLNWDYLFVETSPPEGDVSWMDYGACRDMPTHFFYPTRGANTQFETAVRVCHGCAVQKDCLDYALRTKQKYGVWGGTSERQRIALRAERRAA